MAKIIQIIDVGPDGTRVRLNDGSFVTLDHNAGWAPSIGDQVPHVEKSGTSAKSPSNPATESRAEARGSLRGSPPRMMKDYEDRCPLVAPDALALLKHRGEERESQLSGQIEAAAMGLRERIQELAQVTGKRQRKAAETAFQHDAATLRQQIK